MSHRNNKHEEMHDVLDTPEMPQIERTWFEYRVVTANEAPALEKSINEVAKQGFQLAQLTFQDKKYVAAMEITRIQYAKSRKEEGKLEQAS